MKFHMNLFHKRYSSFKFKLSLGFEFLVNAQENISEEVKEKVQVQIQVKAGIWINKRKQSST